jgi:hypothetical protein
LWGKEKAGDALGWDQIWQTHNIYVLPTFQDASSGSRYLTNYMYIHHKYTILLAHQIPNEVYILHFFTIIGPFPIHDGLFGRPRLAYFSSSPLGLMPAHPFGAL